MATNHSSKRLRVEDLTVDPTARPGWITGAKRTPDLGEEVFCAAGAGEVVRVLGKTSNGSRLLELRLSNGVTQSFFAAASNVLVQPKRKRKR